MKHTVKVIVNIPKDVQGIELQDVIEYVDDAIKSWRGSFAPTNAFFQLNDNEFKVVKLHRAKAKSNG